MPCYYLYYFYTSIIYVPIFLFIIILLIAIEYRYYHLFRVTFLRFNFKVHRYLHFTHTLVHTGLTWRSCPLPLGNITFHTFTYYWRKNTFEVEVRMNEILHFVLAYSDIVMKYRKSQWHSQGRTIGCMNNWKNNISSTTMPKNIINKKKIGHR